MPESVGNPKTDRVKVLENLLAIEIKRVVELTKEKESLERQLEQLQKDFENCRQRCNKPKELKNEATLRDYSEAMVVYGDLDINEVLRYRHLVIN